jgi:7-cyano-7-deazaguanine synthase
VLGRAGVAPLVVLSMPTGDLYGDHWSVSGRGVPDAATADEAVYLPGRNALQAVKPLVWCGMNGIGRLALATLESNPFPDASDGFFSAFSRALSIAMGADLEIVKPFAGRSKKEVMLAGRDAPLAETFSCIDPRQDLSAPSGFVHCGGCNKCAERRHAFVASGLSDETRYAGE